VNEARANASIRSASSLAASSSGVQEAAKSLTLTPPAAMAPGGTPIKLLASESTPAVPLNQQSRFVGTRTFYLNDGRWVDSQVQQFQNANRVKLRFGSDEYFKFAQANSEARPWLAQGSCVEFVFNGTLYEVHE
jgi:hypothetical protein